ncbi:M24 family metallopeptidase [Pseudogracilibacillus sp. ICA-222130]|uniref:M24 family metallopeptidase n=1 Tax=Pseudogracilibacillus sp. ICA-222130 TaxID=3134655 RepID=UPI0030BF7509
MYKERIKQLMQHEHIITEATYILFMDPLNIYYVTNLYAEPHERFFGLLIDMKEKRTTLFLPTLDLEKAKKEAENVDEFIPVGDTENGYAKLAAYMKEKSAICFIEKNYMTVAQYEALQKETGISSFKEVEQTIMNMRLRKSTLEIANVKKAISITEDALYEIIPCIKIGMTENEIKSKLETALRNLGAEKIAFDTMVLTGENSGLPHGEPGDRPIQYGDFLLFDFGVFVDHYCSDITRTFAIGNVSAEQRRIYETVLRANEKAIEAVILGDPIKNIDHAARTVIEDASYGAYFTHRTGHGLGLEVHEALSIHGENEEKITEGLLFTIEPGIYKEGVGGVRIEDDVYVHPNGEVEVLTSFPKQLTMIDAK